MDDLKLKELLLLLLLPLLGGMMIQIDNSIGPGERKRITSDTSVQFSFLESKARGVGDPNDPVPWGRLLGWSIQDSGLMTHLHRCGCGGGLVVVHQLQIARKQEEEEEEEAEDVPLGILEQERDYTIRVCDGFDAAGPDSSDRWMDCEPGLVSSLLRLREREREENEREKKTGEKGVVLLLLLPIDK